MSIRVRWEGSFFSNHSLALVNREIVGHLAQTPGLQLSIEAGEPETSFSWDRARVAQLRGLDVGGRPEEVDVCVRHRWPLDPHPPRFGKWVIMQPWEFGPIPRAWYEPMKFGADEVWVYSTSNKAAYVESGIPEAKIRVIPLAAHPVMRTPPQPFPLRTRKRFKFLFVGGTILRKGIDLLLDAYTREFTPEDDVCLVIKDFGTGSFYRGQTYDQLIRLLQSDSRLPEIEYHSGEMTPEQLRNLFHACDCLVHPYRGEGFGLPIAEAMTCGLPVIVPDQGGASDFCTPDVALLLPSRRVQIPSNLSSGLECVGSPWWLEMRPEDLRARMREVYRDPDSAREIGARARQRMEQSTWEATARHAAEGLLELADGGRSQPRLLDDRIRLSQAWVEEGVSSWERRDMVQALRLFGRAEYQHASDDLLYNIAFVLYAAGDYRMSLRYCDLMLERIAGEEGVDARELAADVYVLRTHCHKELGNAQAARTSVEEALRISSEHPEALALAAEFPASETVPARTRSAEPPRIRWRGAIFNSSGYAEESRSFLASVLSRDDWRLRIEAFDGVVDRGILAPPDFARLASLTGTSLQAVDIDFQHIPAAHVQPSAAPIAVVRTMFETDRIPEGWVAACNRATEVWVPTEFNRETFARAGVLSNKLRVVPGSIDTSRYDPSRIRSQRQDDRFSFLSVFDFLPRKGWDVLLHAWFQEFRAGDPVRLVVKLTTHHGGDPAAVVSNFTRLHGYRNHAPVELITDNLSETQMISLYAKSDAFVLPSRGEGWGRPFMESMTMGLPTIGTRWSGNTEFMTDENSYLIEVEDLEPCEWTWPEMRYYHGSLWARPSVESTRALMRQVVEDREEGRTRGERARRDIVARYDQKIVGAQFLGEFQRLLELL